MELLNENGLIILRDGVKELDKRHRGTKLTELFSTNLGFNKATHPLEFISQSMIKEITSKKGFTFETVDTTKLTSNIIFLIRKNQNNNGE